MSWNDPPTLLILAAVVILGAVFAGMVVVCVRPERYQSFWQRYYAQIQVYDPWITPERFARQAIPMTLFMGAALSMCLVVIVPMPPFVELPAIVGALGLLVASCVLFLVVSWTGRPRALVLRSFRSLTPEQREAWLKAPYVFEVEARAGAGQMIQVGVRASDSAQAARTLRMAGVERGQLRWSTRPVRLPSDERHEDLPPQAPAWRRLGEHSWRPWPPADD